MVIILTKRLWRSSRILTKEEPLSLFVPRTSNIISQRVGETIIWPPNLYKNGTEGVLWEEGVSISNGSRSKENDHLFLEALGPLADWSYITSIDIDLTEFTSLKIDWENYGQDSGQNWSTFVVSGRADDPFNDNDGTHYVNRQEDFERREDSIDISALSGEHLIRIHARGGDSFGEIPSRLKIYRVWVESAF